MKRPKDEKYPVYNIGDVCRLGIENASRILSNLAEPAPQNKAPQAPEIKRKQCNELSDEELSKNIESGEKWARGYFATDAEVHAYLLGFNGGLNRLRAASDRWAQRVAEVVIDTPHGSMKIITDPTLKEGELRFDPPDHIDLMPKSCSTVPRLWVRREYMDALHAAQARSEARIERLRAEMKVSCDCYCDGDYNLVVCKLCKALLADDEERT